MAERVAFVLEVDKNTLEKLGVDITDQRHIDLLQEALLGYPPGRHSKRASDLIKAGFDSNDSEVQQLFDFSRLYRALESKGVKFYARNLD